MSSDRTIYYDFSSETKLADWQNFVQENERFSFDAAVEIPEKEKEESYILLLSDVFCWSSRKKTKITSIKINEKNYAVPAETIPYFIGESHNRNGIFLTLRSGKHFFHVEGDCGEEKVEDIIKISLIKNPLSKVEKNPSGESFCIEKDIKKELLESNKEEKSDQTGFHTGIGCEEIPGRFGFVKGDGVLDYTMFTLGTVAKIYMTGHPRYKKPFLWHYSTCPAGEHSFHGTLPPARTSLANDTVKINHLTSSWASCFSGKKYSCTYSLGTPGLITEYEGEEMLLSDLEYAGNYRYCLFGNKNGKIKVCPLDKFSPEEMGENFVLLYSATEFPDFPLLLVFRKKPETFTVKYNEKTNRLSSISIKNCPLLITATPFGIESFDPVAPQDEKFIEKSARICRFWSRAFLAYPVKCEEYYKHDEANKKTCILQKFSYRYIQDDWGTLPLETAPLPPVAQLSGIMETQDEIDFEFPTQFGPLKGRLGSYSSYTLPWMPCTRKFPLKSTENNSPDLSKLLKEGFDEYFNFVDSFPPPVQSYPYAGAFLEPYAFASALTSFLSREDREKLRKNIAGAVKFICDKEATGDYKAISWSEIMYSNPEIKELLQIYAKPELKRFALKLWNTRREPFTGREYTICYLNLGYFSEGMLQKGTREEIKNFSIPLIENDWGLGLTFYYLLLSVLATGDLAPVKENFAILKSAFHFFEIFHDWACMGSGYSENGVTWCEGANYGAFTGFTLLSELVEDEETLSLARYYSSKQLALRLAIFRASRYYFYKYFGIAPYDIAQSFREGNQIYGQFMNAPKDVKEYGYRPHTLYKMTTEGVYGELFEALRKFLPEDWKRVRSFVGRDLHEMGDANEASNWGKLEPAAVYLMTLALDENVPSEEFEKELEAMKKYNYLMQRWRGIHIFSRRLPQNAWEVQVRAWNEMKKHPLWLTLWKNVAITETQWDGREAKIAFEVKENTSEKGKAFIRLGYRKTPVSVWLDDQEVKAFYDEKENTLQVDIVRSGVLLCKYN